ncbi:MAG: hypothetical protein RLZZ234_833 [Candidatus Parcubacteria bacterium]
MWCVAAPQALLAQESQVLSVTPPFSQMVVKPGDIFKSYLKIINANSYPLTVYATPVNFESSDEQGHPKFVPMTSDPVDATTFAGWIDVTREPITIPPESSTQVDYVVTVPEAAPPGGHFAAILIGTRKPGETGEAGVVQTSQVVSSLFLARVAGEVVEEGQIREFSVAHTFTNTPQAEFVLRFENSGNVYMQPQGDITIFNMWGKERGFIPVNHKTNFGNVLPKSVRKFSFTWEGTPSITDIGRYKAVATLSYGIDAKESVYRTVYFWVIPVKATLITFGFIALFGLFIFLSIRLYVRRVLDMAGIDSLKQRTAQAVPETVLKRRVTRREIVAPLRAGVLDLRRAVVKEAVSTEAAPRNLRAYVHQYRTFIVALCIGLVGVALIVWYVMDAREVSRPYEVTMRNESGEVMLTKKEDTPSAATVDTREGSTPAKVREMPDRVRVSLVNASGIQGAGGSFVSRLEKEGYAIGDISTDADTRERSVIIYNASMQKEAKTLSELWDNIPLSMRPVGEEAAPEILFIIGSDRAK